MLVPLEHIECRDALVRVRPDSAPVHPASSLVHPDSSPAHPDSSPVHPYSSPVHPELVEGPVYEEAPWPRASIVIGNPPFLGGNKKRGELGDAYFEALKTVFEGRVPGGADLVTYWFDKARKHIAEQGLGAAGLVATQAIRAGSNRKVLESIVQETRIFDAWADEEWVNDGAAVRVSLVSFGWGDCCFLNGQRVERVTAELGGSSSLDITLAKPLAENGNVSFEGTQKNGPFDVSGEQAKDWLLKPNPHGKSNADVLRPYANAADVTGRGTGKWMIDFTGLSEIEACLFEAPFSHVDRFVKPVRLAKREAYLAKKYWLLKRPAVDFRKAVESLGRYVITPRVAKHRFFVMLPAICLPDSRLNAITRSDDTTFGILSSRLHEVWSLATASMHGDGFEGGRPTYNAKSCFETFPFPAGLTPADTAHKRTQLLPSGAQIPDFFAAQAMGENEKNLSKNKPSRKSAAFPSQIRQQFVTFNVAKGEALGSILNKKIKLNALNLSENLPESLVQTASRIAEAAHRLNALRQAWLNPPEWTQTVPEVVPLGLATSPYPDRVLPKNGLSAADTAALSKRTLTNLYNQRPAWLQSAHAALDQAVAAAYGWTDYTAALPDEEILARLLALNLARANAD